MASQTPQPASYDQILGEELSTFQAKTGINDVNPGSITTGLLETVALTVARASGDVFQILRDQSVDRASGDALRKIQQDEGLSDLPAQVASGSVTITDTSFNKISTKIYAGANAPNVGSTSILLSDASSFSVTGSVYIGRGTPNVEGPLPYLAVTQIGSYWQLTLSTPTTKFHNINETVILAQGGVRNISAGTTVRSPASGPSPDINFTVSSPAVILDGEVEVSGVQVSAQEPGTVGNVPIGAIKEFAGVPFSGAAVTNPLPFKTGRDIETDEQLRLRIKRARISKGLGTAEAVKNSVINATPSDENSTVTSSQIVTSGGATTLYIDDNTGYEEKTSGVGVEVLVDSALGGEDHFQLETGGRQASVAKAFLVSNLSAPFDVAGDDRLAITVGGITTEHIFSDSDFVSPGGATADEIVASVNADTSLNFSASTSNGSTQVIFFSKTESNESIQIASVTVGRNVADLLELPSNEVQTLRLFKNNKPLSKDGNSATVSSAIQVDWSPSIATGDTLIVSVDGTAFITYTFTDADFISEGSYVSLSSSNSLESWVNVMNSKLTGVTAEIVGEQIEITSNLGASNRAKVAIDPSSSLVTKGMFTSSIGLSATGLKSDYSFSRNTAQIKLASALSKGDSLTAGTTDTEASVQSAQILGGTVTLSSDAYIWILIDDLSSSIIQTGVVANTVIDVSKPSINIVRYTSSQPSAFSNVQVGDYLIAWSKELSLTNRFEGRVYAKTSTTLDIKITSSEYSLAVVESGIVFQDGFIVVRTSLVPEKIKITAGTKSLSEIADELNSQILSAQFLVYNEEVLVLKTKTKTSAGSVLFLSSDTYAKPLGFTSGSSDSSNESLYAFYESDFKEGNFPLFFHDIASSDSSASPPDSFVGSINSTISPSSVGLDPNYTIGFLQPYGSILDILQPSESVPMSAQSGIAISISQDSLIKRIRSGDRLYVASPLDMSESDEIVVILDGDASSKTFSVPLYRKAKTNTTFASNPTSFNAYDLDAGATAPFTTFFPSSFAFNNYKAVMQAKNVIDPSGAQNAILYRSQFWGKTGEYINVGYIYPTSSNLDISHTITTDQNINIRISLKSGAAIPTTIDGTTEWNVTVSPNVPSVGIDQVTFTWNGTGTSPGLGSLSGGEYVTIVSGSELNSANLGTFRVSTELGFAPTANSFTVVRKSGEAVAQSNIATLISGVFSFFQSSTTTAADIQTYISASAGLLSFISATLVNDSGLSGLGSIALSTDEESGFQYKSIYLKDGINWIYLSNISGSPQFSFKKSLDLPTAQGYAFNDGEEIRLVPTTILQLSEFLNVLAVTGITTLGSIGLTERGGRLEISTNTLGGEGSVQVVGGQGNSSSTPVLGTSSTLDNLFALTSIAKAGLDGFHGDQWVKLSASSLQKKEALFQVGDVIKIDGGSPIAGQSTITISNRAMNSRHFGKPRHHVRTQGRTFKVEKQGSLTCISWNGSGIQPYFQKSANLNDFGGGTVNVERIIGTSEARYYVLTGNANFNEVSIGDIVSVQNMLNSANDGTFLVTGVSDDGKILRVLNANAVDEFSSGTFTITNNADISGDDFVVNGNVLTAGIDFVVGGTAAISAQNLASAISALPNVSASSNANIVTIIADATQANISIAYINNSGGPGATVSGAFLVGTSFSSGDFSCITEVSEGDTVVIGSPFNILNQGTYRVIRRYLNSIYLDNSKSIEETVSLSLSSISLGYDLTTRFDINATNNSLLLSWNGVATEPQLGNAQPGDEITLGTDFSSVNQGTFMVTKAEPKAKEITRISLPQGSQISGGQRFHISSANDSILYYIWYKVDGLGLDPAPVGRTGILVNVASTDSASQVASVTAAAIDASLDFSAVASGSYIRITNSGYGPATDATNIDISGVTEFLVVQQGQRTFLEAINPAAINESNIGITNILQVNRPPILFYEYEATVSGDSVVVSSSFLGSSNQSSWIVLKVLSQDKVIVSGNMTSIDPSGASGNQDNIFV